MIFVGDDIDDDDDDGIDDDDESQSIPNFFSQKEVCNLSITTSLRTKRKKNTLL
jgi:hypothetical protein